MPPRPVLEIRGLVKTYGEATVVDVGCQEAFDRNFIDVPPSLFNVTQMTASVLPSSMDFSSIVSALQRDYTVVMGVVIVYAALIIVLNLLVDLIYGLLDPKVRLG